MFVPRPHREAGQVEPDLEPVLLSAGQDLHLDTCEEHQDGALKAGKGPLFSVKDRWTQAQTPQDSGPWRTARRGAGPGQDHSESWSTPKISFVRTLLCSRPFRGSCSSATGLLARVPSPPPGCSKRCLGPSRFQTCPILGPWLGAGVPWEHPSTPNLVSFPFLLSGP